MKAVTYLHTGALSTITQIPPFSHGLSVQISGTPVSGFSVWVTESVVIGVVVLDTVVVVVVGLAVVVAVGLAVAVVVGLAVAVVLEGSVVVPALVVVVTEVGETLGWVDSRCDISA